MKDKILEIMQKTDKVNENKHYSPPDKRQKISAKLIADMIQKFVEWLIIDQEIFMGELTEQYIINDNLYVNGRKLKTLDELFNYWFNNIKDKEK